MANESITKEDLNKLGENLGRIIAKGFEGVDEKFNENTEQHRQIFERFEKIDERFEHIESRLDRIENDLSEIKENMAYKDEHEDLKCRVDLIEGKMGVVS